MTRSDNDLALPEPSFAWDVNPRPRWLEALLRYVNHHCSEPDRDAVVAAVFQATGGSDTGRSIADEWCRRRGDYPGPVALSARWESLKAEAVLPNGLGVLCGFIEAFGFDPLEIVSATEPDFEPCEFTVIESGEELRNELTQYSLAGQLDLLEQNAIEQIPILGGLAVLGQATVLYAAPNTGKTLLTLSLTIATIVHGKVNPELVFYVNVDDSLTGLIEKLRLAEEYRFHMVAEGYRQFRAEHLLRILAEMISKDECQGVVLILDTLKKFTDLMSKRKSTAFGKVIRRFVLKGGTCIFLAHTNKRPGSDGRPVYAGTSDILEDVDCAYVAQVISESNAREKVIAFENIKRRGNVRQRAVFGYSMDDGISYEELLASVRAIADGELATIQRAEDYKSDSDLIGVARSCIESGINTKMRLAAAIAARVGCSKRVAIKVLDKYSGTDPDAHIWTYDVRERGAKTFRLLDCSESKS